ncbi:MAG: SIR2 family protein [Bacteroidota bacterium]|nr:SIR2 family protein [Bacteroidota bacterium]
MLQQVLASDTKRIGFLFGAGTSMTCNKGFEKSVIPGVLEMTKLIIKEFTDTKTTNALQKIEVDLSIDGKPFLIEYILSAIIQKINVIGSDSLCGLNKSEFEKLKTDIENGIIEKVSVHKNLDSFKDNLLHNEFALWIKQAIRKYPIEIFTTNYDYLFELALEFYSIPYFDGFAGSFKPFFFPAGVEEYFYYPRLTKLWKIHGSLGWIKDGTGRIYRDSNIDQNILIYPSHLKYEHSQKLPYVSLQDRLKNFLKEEDGILLICGYSFSDQHINEIILQGLSMTKSSHVIVLYFDDFDENSAIAKISKIEPRLSLFGKRNSIVGCKLGKWKIPLEPDKYELEIIKQYYIPDTGKWTGEGEFLLTDFNNLVKYLSIFKTVL